MAGLLIVRAGGYLVALPISAVVETMRPLPVRAAPGAPPFVRGVAIVRGELLPVIDLELLLTSAPASVAPASGQEDRFVTVKSGARRVSLLVSAVIGIRALDVDALEKAPPLLSQALPEQVERLGVLDGETLAVLGTARLLHEDVHFALEQGAGRGASR